MPLALVVICKKANFFLARLFLGGRSALDGADLDVGRFAGIVHAEAGDPDFTAAEHGSLVVDEEVFVFLILYDGCDVRGDDAVVVFDEGVCVIQVGGFAVELDSNWVVDEGGYGGGIVFGYGLLKIGDELTDFGVISE